MMKYMQRDSKVKVIFNYRIRLVNKIGSSTVQLICATFGFVETLGHYS